MESDFTCLSTLNIECFTWIIDGVSPLLTRNLGFEFTACFTLSSSPPSMRRRNMTRSSDFRDLKLKLVDTLENEFFSIGFAGVSWPKMLKRSASTADLKSLNLADLFDLIAESVSCSWVNTLGVPAVNKHRRYYIIMNRCTANKQ